MFKRPYSWSARTLSDLAAEFACPVNILSEERIEVPVGSLNVIVRWVPKAEQVRVVVSVAEGLTNEERAVLLPALESINARHGFPLWRTRPSLRVERVVFLDHKHYVSTKVIGAAIALAARAVSEDRTHILACIGGEERTVPPATPLPVPPVSPAAKEGDYIRPAQTPQEIAQALIKNINDPAFYERLAAREEREDARWAADRQEQEARQILLPVTIEPHPGVGLCGLGGVRAYLEARGIPFDTMPSGLYVYLVSEPRAYQTTVRIEWRDAEGEAPEHVRFSVVCGGNAQLQTDQDVLERIESKNGSSSVGLWLTRPDVRATFVAVAEDRLDVEVEDPDWQPPTEGSISSRVLETAFALLKRAVVMDRPSIVKALNLPS